MWRKIRVTVYHRLHQRRAILANRDIQRDIFPPIYHGLWQPPPLPWSRHRCCGAATVVVVDTLLPSLLLLSCRHCCGTAVAVVEQSTLSWSRRHRKTKKKKTKTKTKNKKKTKKKKKKQLLRSHYNILKEFATSVQSPCRHCLKSPTRHQPPPTSTSADIASNKRYRKPD